MQGLYKCIVTSIYICVVLDVLDDDEDANEDAEKVYDFTENALSGKVLILRPRLPQVEKPSNKVNRVENPEP